MKQATDWIRALGLERHPEGGWYREIYRSREKLGPDNLPSRFEGERCFSTAIYFLLEGGDFSALHRLGQDEIWHFYEGGALTVHRIDTRGRYVETRLGRNVESGEQLVAVVEAGEWFGATVDDPAAFALVGCTVAPGFEFADFELAAREDLITRFPQHEAIIGRLTRT